MTEGNSPDFDTPNEVDLRLAKPMFGLSILFLILLAALIVLWVDIPRVEVLANEANQIADANTADEIKPIATLYLGDYCVWALLALWPFFWAEFVYKLRAHDRSQGPFFPKRIFDLLICFCPPLRLAAPTTTTMAESGCQD